MAAILSCSYFDTRDGRGAVPATSALKEWTATVAFRRSRKRRNVLNLI
jgi:hypothetical protein